MQIKLYKRSTVMRNMVLFISLSLFFVHIQNSINTGVSSFDLEKFVSLLTTEKTMVLLSLLSIFSVLYANRISKIFFALFSFFVIYNGFATFFTKLDKIILLMNGLYVVLAYFFYLFWHFELNETIKKNVKIYISFAGKEFCQWGEIISGYGNGVGIKFFEGEDEHDLDLKWKDFFSIITDRGYDQYSEI